MSRLAVITLSLLFTLLLVACGDSYGDESAPTATSSVTAQRTLSPSPTAAPTIASATVAEPTPPATAAPPPVPPSATAQPAATSTAPTVAPSAPAEPTPTLRTITVPLDSGAIIVEVADDPAERSQGLSGRDALPRDGGMLFVWDQPAEYTLWMKNMRIPLDFVWLDEQKQVIKVTANVPHQPGASDAELVRYSSGPGALYAIELNAGAAARLGIGVGDVLAFDEN